jgi:pilus assembly protein FimV
MVRKLVVLFTSVVLFAAAHVKALGLGELTLDSALNQPLNARLELLQLGDVRADQIIVQLASESDFARFSIDRENFLNSISFSIQPSGRDAMVYLRTVGPVREPYLSFVLETRWPNGRLLSEHTLLLDLPVFAENASSVPVQQAAQGASSSQISDSNQLDAGVISSDSLNSADSSSAMRMAAPEIPAPAQTADELLTAQSDLDISTADSQAVDAFAAPAQSDDIPSTSANQSQSLAPVPSTSSPETITVSATDTLWDIALQVRPDNSVSVQQTMLALQRLNNEAFIGDNINMVRRGQVLRLPDIEQIRALSAREAIGEVARQNQLFENRRNVPLQSQPVSAAPAQIADADSSNRGELSVVSVDAVEPGDSQVAASGQTAELDARIASLEDVLAVQREEGDRAELGYTELIDRLGLLEQQIASAQEIIRLRNLELAQLQESLAQEVEVPTVEPVDPPMLVTMAPDRSFAQTLLDTLVANTYALLAATGLLILILVYVLLRRNRAAKQEAFAGMEAVPVSGAALKQAVPRNEPIVSVGGGLDEQGDVDSGMDEIFDLAETVDNDLRINDVEQGPFSDEEAFAAYTQHPENIIDIDTDTDTVTDLEDVQIDFGAPDEEISVAEGATTSDLDEELSSAALDFEAVAESLSESALDEVVAEPLSEDALDAAIDVLEEAEALIAHERFPEAITVLQNAIVAEPARAELRLKLLEVYAAKEDLLGFELQETELRDINFPGTESRIAELKAQLGHVLDDEILEEGEAEFIQELDSLNDMEIALDLEASAEVDDNKVSVGNELGLSVDDVDVSSESEMLEIQHEEVDELEPQDSRDLSPEFDLAAGVEPEPEPEPKAVEAEPEGLIDFDIDFDFAAEAMLEADPEPNPPSNESEESDPEHHIDFDFTLVDDDENELNTTSEPLQPTVVEPDESEPEMVWEFDTDVATEAPLTESAKEVDDSDVLQDLQFLADAPEEKPPAKDTAPSGQSEESEDYDFLSDADEAATKLDLARAYFEMGDHDGAREILEEVLKEGSEEQARDAQGLLDKL